MPSTLAAVVMRENDRAQLTLNNFCFLSLCFHRIAVNAFENVSLTNASRTKLRFDTEQCCHFRSVCFYRLSSRRNKFTLPVATELNSNCAIAFVWLRQNRTDNIRFSSSFISFAVTKWKIEKTLSLYLEKFRLLRVSLIIQ